MSEVQVVTDPTKHAFRRHYAEVYRFVRRRTRSDADAKDLTQQVFADAAASLRSDGRPPIAWLYAVARRRFADAARRDSRRRAVQASRDETTAEYGPSVADSLRAAFGRLPDGRS